MLQRDGTLDHAKEKGLRNVSGLLSEDEIRLIGQLSVSLDHSSLDFLRLDTAGMQVCLAKGRLPTAVSPAAASVLPRSSPQGAQGDHAESHRTVAVKAPLIGFYYLQAELTASPFVTEGSVVDEATTIGLISHLDVLTSVPASISGIITEICVVNGQFVEYGQVLCRIRPTMRAAQVGAAG